MSASPKLSAVLPEQAPMHAGVLCEDPCIYSDLAFDKGSLHLLAVIQK